MCDAHPAFFLFVKVLLSVRVELSDIEMSDVVEVFLHLTLSVIDEHVKTLLEQLWRFLSVLKEKVSHNRVGRHLIELA